MKNRGNSPVSSPNKKPPRGCGGLRFSCRCQYLSRLRGERVLPLFPPPSCRLCWSWSCLA